jgi:hypothetical protein
MNLAESESWVGAQEEVGKARSCLIRENMWVNRCSRKIININMNLSETEDWPDAREEVIKARSYPITRKHVIE